MNRLFAVIYIAAYLGVLVYTWFTNDLWPLTLVNVFGAMFTLGVCVDQVCPS